MKKVLMGNHAVSYGVCLSKAEVVSAYPITPQTHIVEELSEMCADGRLKARFVKVESEHSAMACCIGASAAGARTFTATSSQGLALMHELLHWSSGARLPIVMANVNRALGSPWNILCDQTDSIAQRDTGWLQFYVESNQEAFDTVIQAYRISERISLPSMIIMDAFFLSHTYEIVDVPDQGEVDAFLPPFEPDIQLDVSDPHTFGSMSLHDYFMEFRYKIHKAMEEATGVAEETDSAFEDAFGRSYGMVSPYCLDDAEIVLVTSGTISGTARLVVDRLRDEGWKIGMMKIKLFRPFPTEKIRDALAKAEKIAVIDRNCSFGSGGGFASEIKAALYNNGGSRPPIFGYVVGLGGRDVTPETILEIANRTHRADRPEEESIWIGIR